MDWLERMNNALNYIENSLNEEIDYKEIAKAANCSEFHFSRMFSSISGISLSEYIRRRRLTLAAFEIQKSDIRIIDVAIKYGYVSSDTFSRAFQKMHGVTPSNARNRGVQLKAFPRISFQISIKGDTEMEYRIENLDFEKIVVNQQVGMSSTLYCKPPISYRDREVIPADAVLPLIDCVGVTRAREVV